VFEQLQALLLDELGAAGRKDLERMGRHRWTIERTGAWPDSSSSTREFPNGSATATTRPTG
jgi:hypothetical protein